MKRTTLAAVAALAMGAALPLSNAYAADLTPQQMALMKVDVTSLGTGFRASKIIGSSVRNDAKESIGKIDDLIINRADKVPFAVISVGGFLGIGTKLVAVPYDSLTFQGDDIVLPGGTKDALKALPKFEYAHK